MSSTSHQHDWIYVNAFQARCALCGTVRLEKTFRVPCDEAHRYFGTLTEAVADRDSRGEFGAIEQYDELNVEWDCGTRSTYPAIEKETKMSKPNNPVVLKNAPIEEVLAYSGRYVINVHLYTLTAASSRRWVAKLYLDGRCLSESGRCSTAVNALSKGYVLLHAAQREAKIVRPDGDLRFADVELR